MRRSLCQHCRKRLDQGQRIHPECVDGFADAQEAKAKRTEVKKLRHEQARERAEIRERKAALKRIPDLIATAQIAFNAFIRERDKDKGCFVCGRAFSSELGRVQHAGHVRGRGAAGHLRYTESNCLGECEGCNGPRGAKPHEIKAGAIARIGLAEFDALEANNVPHKWERGELIEIAATYRRKLKELKARTE